MMNKRQFLSYLGGISLPVVLPGCGGGDTSTETPVVRPLGMAIPDPLDVAKRMQAYVDWGDTPLPASMDNSSGCPPVGDQGNLGSCTAWATAYGLASYVAAKTGGYFISNSSQTASAADMYAKLLNQMSAPCNTGTMITAAMDILCRRGVASSYVAPYSDAMCMSPGNNGEFRIRSYLATRASDRIGLKRQIASGNVLAFGSRVTDDIYGNHGQTYYAAGSNIGGHAMLLVGYDDTRSAYKVMNSWGKGWGNQGYFWFDYAAFERTTVEACSAIMTNTAPKPLSNLPATVTGVKGSAITDTYYNKEFLYVFVEFSNLWTMEGYTIKKDGVLIGEKSGISQLMDATQIVLSKDFDLTGYPPGKYNIEMKGKDVNGAPLSLTTQFIALAFIAKVK